MSYETLQDALNSSETLIFGHRGAMARAPMNTMASFALAMQQGADGIELDIHLSRDGQLVVIHDDSVDATSDGQGKVADMTLDQLKRLDAGAWYSDEFAGQRIPTLDEVFDAFGDGMFINVEIKSSRETVDRLEKRLAECLRRHNMRERVIVSCFDPVILRRAEQAMPKVLMGFLYAPAMPAAHEIPLKEIRHEARHPLHVMVDEGYMKWARAQGYYVNVWTVNDPERARQLKRLGVNTIMTDDPATIISALSQC
ncbi:MAG: glycerophosphodiester phosphodiesterase family protein [Chloroflexota bacterium]|nr:glycerophosphodiester phosphodiesterase family protein [Chloroflexota bacterium]